MSPESTRMRLLLFSSVLILLPWSSTTSEFLASANSFFASSWGRSWVIAIMIPKKNETTPSMPIPATRMSRRSFLMRPGFGLRGRRAVIRRGSRGRWLAGSGGTRLRTPAGTRSRSAWTRSRLSAIRSLPTRRRLCSPFSKAFLMVEPRRATRPFCGWVARTGLEVGVLASSWSPLSRRARSSSKSRIGLGRREARRRASLAKLRASPGVGGPAGPSSRSRRGERVPGPKTSPPKLSQSPSPGSTGVRGLRGAQAPFAGRRRRWLCVVLVVVEELAATFEQPLCARGVAARAIA